jgi:outer membrane protein assembly factor BamD
MKPGIYILAASVMFLISCSKYDKLLKSDDFELKKSKAKEYFEKKQYVRATELLEQVLPRYRATGEAEELSMMNAKSYFGMRQYDVAGVNFKSCLEMYPYGRFAEEACFMTALCSYKLSPRAQLDQENTRLAIEGFSYFIDKYPRSSRIEESKILLKEMEERLVEKSYLSARLYYDMKMYKAAIVALSNSLKENTASRFREEMMYLKLNSLFQYAENSFAAKQKERYQDTLDDYFSFMEEYPSSRYSKEIREIYDKTNRFLKSGTADTTANNHL